MVAPPWLSSVPDPYVARYAPFIHCDAIDDAHVGTIPSARPLGGPLGSVAADAVATATAAATGSAAMQTSLRMELTPLVGGRAARRCALLTGEAVDRQRDFTLGRHGVAAGLRPVGEDRA